MNSMNKSDFFGEILRVICDKYDKKKLAVVYNEIFTAFKDKDPKGDDVPFEEIDPFSFIASINSGKDLERKRYCRLVKDKLEISAQIPENFSNIPSFNPFRVRFIPYLYNGGSKDADKIWTFVKSIVSGAALKKDEFEKIIGIINIGLIRLSQILSICFPDKYYLMDKKTCRFLNFVNEENFESFIKFQNLVKEKCPDTNPEEFSKGVSDGTMGKLENVEEVEKEPAVRFPLNQILFGPAGTGKTYNALIKAMEIIDERKYDNITDNQYRLLKQRFDVLRKSGRIEMVTFHSNYTYEEFVEGIKPNTENKELLTYSKENGIFKSIVNIAKAEKIKLASSNKIDFSTTRVFKLSLSNTANREDGDIYEYCMDNNVIAMGYGEEVDFSCVVSKNDIKEIIENGAVFKEKRFSVKAIEKFKLLMRPGDIVLISNGNDNIRAIARITSEYEFNDGTELNYCHFRQVKWLYRSGNIPVEKILITNKLPRQPIYSFFNPAKEGMADYNENINTDYLQQLLCGSLSGRPKNYVMIIDEINRGDISKIFGELTTLLDDDKRLGEENELTVKLPYTKELFGIPKNLYIIGTMSMSDRMTSPIDIALRRRFSFTELKPRLDLISQDIREALELVNKRIHALLGSDYLIGHGYFMNHNKTFQEVWFTSIIPLIAEYCRGHWENLQKILGKSQSALEKKSGEKYSSFIKRYTTDELNIKGDEGYCYGFASQEECDFDAAIENLKRGTK